MTTTYDPFHPKYFDDADLREEMTRVFDLCHGCRLCFKFCDSFPILFAAVDQHDDQDAAKMTRAEQDAVVDGCWQCKLCYVNCPYIPELHEWNLDFPRLMMRAEQVRFRDEKRSVHTKLTDQALGNTDLVGKLNTAVAPLANKAIGTPDSTIRSLMQKTVGIAAKRVLPPYNRTRFSTWFRKRQAARVAEKQATAVLFPTCIVEYQAGSVGRALVDVYEHNGIECVLPEGQVCCGAPFLHQGDVERFRKNAHTNIHVLAQAIRDAEARGEEVTVVAPQPPCGYVLTNDYVDYIGGPAAELVASHTMDSSEYLWDRIHKGDDTALDLEFPGEVPESIAYHAPCHLRAQNVGLKSRDLLKKTGAKVTVVAECSAIDGTWGLREENYDTARKYSAKLGRGLKKADAEAIAGDCNLANGGIVEEVGQQPSHPMEILARAYGIDHPVEEQP